MTTDKTKLALEKIARLRLARAGETKPASASTELPPSSLNKPTPAQRLALIQGLKNTPRVTTKVDSKLKLKKREAKKKVTKPRRAIQGPVGRLLTAKAVEFQLIPVRPLTQEEQVKEGHKKIRAVAQDFYRYCEVNLKINTKTEGLQPLKLNAEQRMIVDHVLTCLRDGVPIRIIILKGRQQGVSTVVEALIYWWTGTHKYQHSKIIAHDQETAENLYNMFKRYYDNSNPLFKPKTKYNTRNDLTFDRDDEKGLKSQIDTGSAENTSAGRGQTIHWLHGSEIAKWRNGAELVAGLMQAVPLAANTAIFLESTANGMGDYFHETWRAAKLGESSFTPLFFPWSMHEEYRLPVPKTWQLTKEEQQLKDEYNLDDEQLVWRRLKMREFIKKPDDFFQEYPINEAEAFLASGRPRFDIKKVLKLQELCVPGKHIELIESSSLDKPEPHKVFTTLLDRPTSPARAVTHFKVVSVPNAPLTVWNEPKSGHEYVIGGDVAEGVGGDYSVATVIDKEAQSVVARWRGDVEPSDFGETLEQLGRWYNQALIGVEINNHGLTTVQRLVDMLYPNLYRRETKLDERFQEHTSRLGWKTDQKTKPHMINHLAEAIHKEQLHDPDIIAAIEYQEYVVDDRGRTNAQEGKHDDCVMSTAIALMLFEWVPIKKTVSYASNKISSRFLANQQKYSRLKRRTMART